MLISGFSHIMHLVQVIIPARFIIKIVHPMLTTPLRLQLLCQRYRLHILLQRLFQKPINKPLHHMHNPNRLSLMLILKYMLVLYIIILFVSE